VFMAELGGNILLSCLSFACSRSSLPTKYQNTVCKITSEMYMGVQYCKEAKEKNLPLTAAGDFSVEAEAVKTTTQASPASLCTHALRGINQGKALGFDVPSLTPADLMDSVEASGSRPWKQKLIKIMCPFSGLGTSAVPSYPLMAFAGL